MLRSAHGTPEDRARGLEMLRAVPADWATHLFAFALRRVPAPREFMDSVVQTVATRLSGDERIRWRGIWAELRGAWEESDGMRLELGSPSSLLVLAHQAGKAKRDYARFLEFWRRPDP